MNIEEATKILELGNTHSRTEVRRAYLRMVKRFHPDLYQDYGEKARATLRFIRAKNAYDTIIRSLTDDAGHYSAGNSSIPYADEVNFGGEEDLNDEQPFEPESSERKGMFEFFTRLFPGELLSALLIPVLMVSVPYLAFFSGFHDKMFGEDASFPPNVKSKGKAFLFMAIATVGALAYLGCFNWAVLTKMGEISPTTWRIVVGAFCSIGTVLLVIDQWVSFLVYLLFRGRVKKEMNKFAIRTIRKEQGA